MSFTTLSELTRHGPAHRATVVFGERSVQFEHLSVWLDTTDRLAHLLDAEMKQHLATVPLDSIFVEWHDVASIQRVSQVPAATEMAMSQW